MPVNVSDLQNKKIKVSHLNYFYEPKIENGLSKCATKLLVLWQIYLKTMFSVVR